MTGWTKLFGSIVTSSVWMEPHPILRVWVAMLAMADARGIVEGSIPGFASLCRVTIDEMKEAVERFSSPDPYSRSPEEEGRRIEIVPGGWRIINRNKYRDKWQDQTGSRATDMRRYRQRKKNDVTKSNALPKDVTRSPETETEKDKEINKESFGEFKNVLLTQDELKKVDPKEIEALSSWLASTGKKRKSHYATILTWRRRNESEKPKWKKNT